MVYEWLLHRRLIYILPVLQIICLTASGFLFGSSFYVLSFLSLMTGLLLILLNYRIYKSSHKVILSFFHALENNDTSVQYSIKNSNQSMKAIYYGLNKLNAHFQQIKLRNEINEKYYRALIKHSATGLLVLNNDKIELINNQACKYAGISGDSINTNLLAIKNPEFYKAICRLRPGEDITYRHVTGNDVHLLLFRATLLQKNKETVKLVSIQDIRHELEARELDSYKKLIRVMTHEIMNLMSPLTSVVKVLHNLYYKEDIPVKLDEIDESYLGTTLSSLKVINEQSEGILNFIDNYRKISRIPSPVLTEISVDDWIAQLAIVYSDLLKEKNIDFSVSAERSLKIIIADKNLLNQAVINLINNAIDAVEEAGGEKKINIELKSDSGRIRIIVSNSGFQIPDAIQDKIFVPFFTTKKNGSGIGLSICQEIMKLHRGSISVVSHSRVTSFIMEL